MKRPKVFKIQNKVVTRVKQVMKHGFVSPPVAFLFHTTFVFGLGALTAQY